MRAGQLLCGLDRRRVITTRENKGDRGEYRRRGG